MFQSTIVNQRKFDRVKFRIFKFFYIISVITKKAVIVFYFNSLIRAAPHLYLV